ncbi:hypothetical protein [Phascolarctobacterium faecium]|jgi:hypothetical protein|uniref:hypothetical protein n=1 Tax=Phascolarctobacterium faecium TaxID=33025 RepID=UPI001032A1FC|nr:hypothetical protein [Phascolarctobacterium faecium]
MKKEDFIKDWKKFLIDIGKSETELSKEVKIEQSGINRRINSGSFKYLELSEIVEKYGYSIKIHKGDTEK